MNPNIPSPKFDERDATRVIATFGAKPSEETKEKLQSLLQNQKEQFLANERGREVRGRDDRSR